MWKMLNALPFRMRLHIHYLLCVTGALLMMASGEFRNFYPLLIAGGLTLSLGLAFRILLIKCPHCGDGLYQNHADLKTCPKCGKPLQAHTPSRKDLP